MELITRSVPFTLERSKSDANGGLSMAGYAAVFNSVTRIDSYEGRFDEQLAPGAFARSISKRTPKLQFDHGTHPLLGSIPIGQITALRETERGLWVEADLHDNWLTEPVRDAIASGSIDGMSFRFSVPNGKEKWDRTGDVPLRTITEVNCAELGPVVFPAYSDTTVSVRAMAALCDLGEVADALRTVVDEFRGAEDAPDELEPENDEDEPELDSEDVDDEPDTGDVDDDAPSDEDATRLADPTALDDDEPSTSNEPDSAPESARQLTRQAATLRLLALKGRSYAN